MEKAQVHQALQKAGHHLNSGQVQQAEAFIRKVLQIEPDNHEALNLLGVIALNSGHAPQAVDLFKRAIDLHALNAEYHCNLAVALLNTNQGSEGEQALRAALKLTPAHPMANFNLGLRDLQAERFDEALHHLKKAEKKMPQNPAVLNALGVAHSKCNKLVKAIQLFRTTLKIHPNHLDAQLNLASALVEVGKATEAISLYKQLIGKHPNPARLAFNLAVALHADKRLLEAIDSYEQALSLEPKFLDALINVSNLYSTIGNHVMALERIKSARDLNPNDLRIMENEANLFLKSGFSVQALAAYERILSLDPGNQKAIAAQIRALHNEGRFEEAQNIAAQALNVNPEAISVLLALSQDKSYTFTEENIRHLMAASVPQKTTDVNTGHVQFALATLYNHKAEHKSAFGFYKQANALCDAQYIWSQSDEQNLFTALTDTFSSKFFETSSSFGHESNRPIFIVGMPRSGTTLVEQIIASHPQAEGGGELPEISAIAYGLSKTLNSTVPYPACIKDLNETTVNKLSEHYLERLKKVSGTAIHVTDKMPENYLHLGLIAQLFPNARIIHCRRDALATCFSIYQQSFNGYQPYAYDLTKIGRRYRNYEHLMDHWRATLPLSVLEVSYEELVQDQEQQSRRILEFCNLDWDDRVLAFEKTQRRVQTASLWQVRQPMYTNALEAWRKYEDFLSPLKEALRQNEPIA